MGTFPKHESTERRAFMAKIVDVAKAAGVSKSTVSRVLNNEPSVKEATRKAVEKAIEELHYSPSYFAQGIRTRRTKTIALLVPEYTNYFYADMFRGAEDVALMNKYMVLVCSTQRHSNAELEYIKELLHRNIDGIIYNTYNMSDPVVKYLKSVSADVPIVMMNRVADEDNGFSHIYTDGHTATKKAVQYLYQRGRRKIGYVRNAKNISITDDRYNGYLAGMEACGLPVNPEFVYQAEETTGADSDYIQLGRKIGTKIADQKNRPDAILATIDMLAIGCVKEFICLGIKVPDEINVMGFDNVSMCEMIDPELTTIAQPTREMGQKAAEIVISKIRGEKVKDHIVMDGRLIIRKSTS